MKRLKVDFDDIAFAMEMSDDFGSITLFDTETGEVVSIPYDYPEEEKRWFAFKDKRMKEEIIEWLNSIGIEPVKG